MAPVAVCPTPEELRQLVLGLLPEGAGEGYAAHVERCPRCLATLRGLAVSDPLLEAVARLPQDTPAGNDPAVQTLISRLSQVRVSQPSTCTLPGIQGDSEPDPAAARHELATAVGAPGAPAVADVPPSLTGHPRYRVLALLGSGGMGAVYKAQHLVMERLVALKVIGRHLLEKGDAVERFRQEMRTAARLHHPNIVTAYDAEQAGDVHFLVMEFVEGTDLASLLGRQGSLPVDRACAYIRQAAVGLQHAHEQGMVHRDIKPHNLMVTRQGQVKILDFGLARFVRANEKTEAGLTAPGTAMGTPDYMAPEQATDARRTDIRADIYSLGCTLYHLLTGQPPFPEGGFIEKALAHIEQKPAPLTGLRKDVPAELAQVVERMMAKNPDQRYQTPAEVARALAPFADPATAAIKPPAKTPAKTPAKGKQPPSPPPAAAAAPERRAPEKKGGSFFRWPLAIAAAMTAGVLLAVAAAIIYVVTDKGTLVIKADAPDVSLVIRGGGQEVTVSDARTNGQVKLRPGEYEVSPADPNLKVKLAPDRFTITRGGQTVVEATLEKAPAGPGSTPPLPSSTEPVEFVEIQQFAGHKGQVNQAVLSADGRTLLSGGIDGTVRLWEVATGKEIRRLEGPTEQVWCVAFSPDGKLAAAAGGGRGSDFRIFLWNLDTGKDAGQLEGHTRRVKSLAFSPDGRHLLSGSLDATVRLWDVKVKKEVKKLPGQEQSVHCVALSPDGRRALSGGWDGRVVLADVQTGAELRRFEGHTGPVLGVAFSPDGRRALTGSLDRTVRLWNVETGRELHKFPEQQTGVTCVAFSPDGSWVVSGTGSKWENNTYRPAGFDNAVRLWGAAGDAVLAHQDLGQVDGSFHAPTSLSLAADGKFLLVAAAAAGPIRLWCVQADEKPRSGGGPPGHVGRLVVAENKARVPVLVRQEGKLVAVLTHTRSVLDLPPGEYELSLALQPDNLELSHRRVTLTKGATQRINVRPKPDKAAAAPMPEVRPFKGHTLAVRSVGFNPDGRLAVSGSTDGSVRLWDVETGQEQPRGMTFPGEVWAVAIGPLGHHVLAAGGGVVKDGKIQPGGDYGIRMWQVETGTLDRVFKGHTERVLSVAFGPQGGRHFLSGGWDGVMRYYAIRNSEEVREFKGHRGGILSVAFSHDAKQALSGGFDQTVRLWDVATGEQVRVLEGHTARVTGVAFLPGDRQAVSVSLDRTMRLWDLDTGKEVRSFPHPTGVSCVATGPGPHVLTGSGWAVGEDGVPKSAGFDSCVRLWDVNSGEQLARSEDQGGAVTSVAVAPDGRSALMGGLDSSVRLLKLPE